jgi:predicted DNA-binding protein (UPF0251 family)
MGSGSTRPTTPDLFSPALVGEASPSPPKSPPSITEMLKAASSPRHVLPKDLPTAIKHLNDDEFDRLLSAVAAEQKRRGRKPPLPDEPSHKRQTEAVTVTLTQGKLNAVRAAFKAGVTPSRIARQFGVSQADVRKALASDKAKR